MLKELKEYVEKHGCFCGGSGHYTDYNCGVEGFDPWHAFCATWSEIAWFRKRPGV